MGLFEKKFCGICGNKIGLLGNKKLADANMCGDCEKKLSVWFSGRKGTALEQIKAQLAYRESNAAMLADFRPTEEIGTDSDKFVLIDRKMGRFVILRCGEAMNKNPDLLELDRVRDVRMEVKEDRSEVRRKDADGNFHSYNPKHYSYRYNFKMTVDYDGEFFDTMQFDINGASINGGEDGDAYNGQIHAPSFTETAANQFLGELGISGVSSRITRTGSFSSRSDLPGGYRPDGYTTMKESDIQRYRECEAAGAQIISALLKKSAVSPAQMLAEANAAALETMKKQTMEANAPEGMSDIMRVTTAKPAELDFVMGMRGAAPAAAEGWSCPFCGSSSNTGNFCKDCGAPRQ